VEDGDPYRNQAEDCRACDQSACTSTLVVMNTAVPVFEATGSGVETGGGICAGTVTENVAVNELPFSSMAFPLSLLTLVWFAGSSVTDTVPMPGTV